MSGHQKRLAVPKSWPVARKEETYTTKADAGPHGEAGVPLLIVLRDVLGYVDSKKEARYALGQDSVVVNGDPVSDERLPIGMFDILAFLEREEYYRVFPDEGGRLALTPIDEDAAGSKLGKIVGKTQVPGGQTQLTLHDGRTLVVDDADTYATTDSIVVSNTGDEIVAHFTYEEGALVTAVKGSHAGRVGTVEEIRVTPGSSDNDVTVDAGDGDTFETIEEFVVVIDENFTAGDEAAVTDADETAAVEADRDETGAEERDRDEPDDEEAASEAAVEPEDAESEAADVASDESGVDESAVDESEGAEEPGGTEAAEEGETEAADETDEADAADETDEGNGAEETDEADAADETEGGDEQ